MFIKNRHQTNTSIKMNLTLDSDTTLQLPSSLQNISIGMLLNEMNFSHFAATIANGVTGNADVNISALMENLTMHLDHSDNIMPIHRDPMAVVIPVTICYAFIFIAGLLGNVITCTVISRNKSMHTATNYYLFNLAVSDLLLLLSGESLIRVFIHFSFFFLFQKNLHKF